MKRLLCCLLAISATICNAQESTDSLELIIKQNQRDVPTARALNTLAHRYSRTDPSLSVNYALRGLEISRETGHDLSQSASLSTLTTFYQNAGNKDSASYYLELLEKLAENATGIEGYVVKTNYNSTAGLYHKKNGNIKKALPYFKASIQYAEKADRKIAVAGQSLNLANTFLSLGQYQDALEYYFQALDKFEQLNHIEGQSFCHQGIGNSFLELKQYEKAETYLRKSFEIKKRSGDTKGMVVSYKSLGELAASTNDFNSAIQNFTKALEHARTLKLAVEERTIAFALGKAYKELKDNTRAEKFLQLSKEMAETGGDELTASAADMELAAMRTSNIETDSTETVLRKNLQKLETIGYTDQTLSAYQHLAKFYAEQGDYRNAFEAKEHYYKLRDSLKGNELLVMLNSLEEKYNSEKKEKEIAELKRDQAIADAQIREQKWMQSALVGLLALSALIGFLIWNRYKLVNKVKRQAELEQVRNNIARDLHDDIGSTLSSINILSKVMLNSPEAVNAEGLKKINQHSGNIMESMGDIVWAINPSNDTVEKLVARMKEFVAGILEPLNINYSFNVDRNLLEMKIDPARKKDLFLIVKESVNNAAKYSECSTVNISFTQLQKMISLKISDDGKGMTASTTGGNGISNIRSRAAALLGEAVIKTAPGEGTEVLVSFPIT